MCQHLWTCRRVLICANMCGHVPASANMWNHSQHIWYQPFETYLACCHVSAHMDMPHVLKFAGTCWHVPTCDINLDTSDSDNLYLIWMLACVSICGHVDMCWYVSTCADICRHEPTCDINLDTFDSSHLDPIGMLACVSICGNADMCWYVPTYDATLSTSDTNHLNLILRAGMCQHIWTCRYVLIIRP